MSSYEAGQMTGHETALGRLKTKKAQILYALEHASVRPKTPVYQVVSISISHLVSPPAGINPSGTVTSMTNQINNALQSKGLVP